MFVPEQEALMTAAGRGVSVVDGAYRFFDIGSPLTTLYELPAFRENGFDYGQVGYLTKGWASRADKLGWRTIRLPVEGSFGKALADQEKCLRRGEKVPTLRSVVMLLVVHALATGVRLLPDRLVRCSEVSGFGDRIAVGHFSDRGFRFDDYYDDGPGAQALGIAAERN